MRGSRALVTRLGLAALLAGGIALGAGAPEISAPLKSEKLTLPPDVPAPSFDRIEMRREAAGTYTVSLVPSDRSLVLPSVDLRLLVPRVPALARGNADLTKIALVQREFNRNEVHNDLPGGLDFSIANNCLRQGLWEIKLTETRAGKTQTLYHAWFDFPKPAYAALFEEVNGFPYADWDALFSSYPKLAGLPVPLAELRRIASETTLPAIDLHSGDPLQRLPEQAGKVKLLLTPIATYGDFAAPGKQPIVTARFSEPGFYDPNDPMKFDLAWLAHPTRTIVRKASPPAGGAPYSEIEIDFENGNRILFADSRIDSLVGRAAAPEAENDVLKIVSGIGTPTIHAKAGERAAELAEDRPRYLFLLDSRGALADNHFGGIDGIYLWKNADAPRRLQVWIVGYERIAFVAHATLEMP
ncbi:MAG TPA: hypothetical protein VFS34_03065 [Thermoanaerobaculia bacterium]|nr:hypothetical protein [Thermoanaerobaculia bacterium]